MYTSKLLVVGTAAILCLVGLSSPSLACGNDCIGNDDATEMVSLEEDSRNDLSPAADPVDAVATSGRFRNYKGKIIDTKDYIRARY